MPTEAFEALAYAGSNHKYEVIVTAADGDEAGIDDGRLAHLPPLPQRVRIIFDGVANLRFLVDGVEQTVLGTSPELAAALDELAENSQGGPINLPMAGAVVASVSLSSGFVVWMLRSGALLASLLAARPAWTNLDPLPIFDRRTDGTDLDLAERGTRTVKATPHLRLSLALVALLLSTVLVADFLNLLPRPEQQIRESRKILGEALAIQLSGAVSNGGSQLIQPTLEEIVRRNDDIVYAALLRRDGLELASFGDPTFVDTTSSDLSSDEDLVIPIYEGDMRWGEARLGFAPDSDWGWRYLGISSATLVLMGFLAAACLLTFYLFMRKALSELDPSKVVPRRVMAAFDVLAEGVLIIDERERIVLANRSFATRIGEEPESMVGKNPTRYDWDLKGDALEELPWQTVLKSGEHIVGMPLKIRVDGDQTAFTVNAAPIEDNDGARKGVLITFDDVTPLEAKNAELAKMLAELSVTHQIIEQKNEQLKTLATRDALTGCLNRRAFLESYQEQYSQAERKQTALSVLMIDIDNFKRVNDQYGHLVGDHALKFVSDVIKGSFDRSGFVGRYGGEEFAVALPGVSLEEGLQSAEAFRQAVSKRSMDGLPLESLTVSVGVASFARGLKDSTELLDRADRALYKAKQAGRDRVHQYELSDAVQVARLVEPAPQEEPTHTLDVSQLRARLRDMKKLIREQASDITHKSMHDELTGLPNRFLFQDRLSQAIRSSDRDDSITAVMCLSLSRYRETYDLVGYAAAEELIRQAAKRLESVVRKGDSGDLVYDKRAVTFSRIAENELAMLIVDLHTVESVTSVVSRLTERAGEELHHRRERSQQSRLLRRRAVPAR